MSHSPTPDVLALGVPGFTYADLYRPERLRDLHDVFLREVGAADADLLRRWDEYRADPDAPRPAADVSLLFVRMAPYLSRFLARMFGIDDEVRGLAAATAEQDVLFRFKADFVRRRVLPLLKGGQPVAVTDEERTLVESLVRGQHPSDGEMALARAGCLLLDREIAAGKSGDEAGKTAVASAIDALRKWCAAHMSDDAYRSWVVFKTAGNVDYFKLVEVEHTHPDRPTSMEGPESHLRRRDGFTLTDPRMTGREVLSEVNYCVLCHEREKDSCATGLFGKDGKVQENPLGIPLEGCPLDERISEMHLLRKRGDAVGALALVTVDNPMCAGTGHRICNDCMKACIFQKQDPVNIPQIETGILTDVLRLPWGVEIYGLLTRWNPLNVRRPYALPYNGRKVLVVGMGPAGYTLAHYLVNEGFGVVGVDGLKIEPLPAALTGTDTVPPEPVRDWAAIYSPLDERPLEGFGGVSEYGITVRWDKNFLTLIHLVLARRSSLRMYGGIRFGGTLSMDDAWAYGFDHVAIAAGAGKPTIVDMKNNLLRGIRQASDLLMALQLTGAFKRGAFANLQVRMPCVVIGGGLTAIDTATEVMAFYPLQVEKILDRYESLCARSGESAIRQVFDAEEQGLLDEFLAHGSRGARRAGPGRGGRRLAEFRAPHAALGGRVARVPQGHDRFARLPAEPRGNHEVARGRHRLRRADEPGGGHPGRLRACLRRALPRTDQRERQVARRRHTSSRCRRGPCSWPRAQRPTSRTSASTPARSRWMRGGGSSSRTSPSGPPTAPSPWCRRRKGSSLPTTGTASTSPTTATTTRSTPAMS